MSVSAVLEQPLCQIESLPVILAAIHGQYGRKLFVSERFFGGDIRSFADEHFRGFGNFKAGHLGNCVCRLTDDLRVDGTFDQNDFSQGIGLLLGTDMSASRRKLGLHRVVQRFGDEYRLLGCADHTVVKCLGMKNRADSGAQITRLVKNGRRVARPHADGRFS